MRAAGIGSGSRKSRNPAVDDSPVPPAILPHVAVELIRIDDHASGEWIPVEVAVDGRRSGEFSILRPVYRELRRKEKEFFAYLERMALTNMAVSRGA
jgi:hypothetical protein